MNKIRNHSKELIVLTILLAVAVSVVNAAVFVYYPISIEAKWQERPIYFDEGSNAGKADLGLNNNIEVIIDEDETNLTITVHPCRRQTTYYKNVSLIINGDNQNYYVGFDVSQAFDDPIDEAYLIVRPIGGGSPLLTVDLKKTGLQGWYATLSANTKYRIDLKFKISDTSTSSQTAEVQLVYSPTTESPQG